MQNISKAPYARMEPRRSSLRSPQAFPSSPPIAACARRCRPPRHRTPFFRAIVAALPLLAGSWVLSSSPVQADEGRAIAGQFHMGLVIGPTCPSATGVCATGTVTGDLSGEIFVTIDDLKNAQDPRGEVITHLSGDVLITTIEGDMRGTLSGVFEQSTGEVRNMITLTSGDRRYRKTTGKLRVAGKMDLLLNVEEDHYSGELGQ